MKTTAATFFDAAFHALTGNDPFPWQQDFFRRLISGERLNACNIPTGLGKTAIIAIWLIALGYYVKSKAACNRIPRRLVYVVNRRTVVDQSTSETERIRNRLNGKGELSDGDRNVLRDLRALLATLCAADHEEVLAISTLRGQFADNGEWCSDPARPAVIVGTVDMIGSRLLFSGYGVGFKRKPLHAGFLGQDALLVHDEAHLEPAFQELLAAIDQEQKDGRTSDRWPLRIMELTATSRGQDNEERPCGLTDEEKNPPDVVPDPPTKPIEVVWRRLTAKKRISFYTPEGEKEKVADRIGKLTKAYSESHPGSAILVFVNSLEDHAVVCKALKGEQVQVLTGTLRGLERDRLAKEDPVFGRFYRASEAEAKPGTVYLVCTSAGEVGIDISADHLVCDLTAFDRMVQRFGRVNRFGAGDANIDIVHEATPDKKKENDPNERARWQTLQLLKELRRIGERLSASPLALMQLRDREDLKPKFALAYSPQPTILPVSDILFDAWALTTVKGKLPGSPPVGPYLHGISDRDPPETYVAWREEVGELDRRRDPENEPLFGDEEDRREFEKFAEAILDDYPLKPHELLRDITFRKNSGVRATLVRLAERREHLPVWIQDLEGSVSVMTLADLADAKLGNRTVLLPPQAGGLNHGMLTADAYDPVKNDYDVADEWHADAEKKVRRRARVWNDAPEFERKTQGMRLIRRLDFPAGEEGEDGEGRSWHCYELPKAADNEGSKSAQEPVRWAPHTKQVTRNTERVTTALKLSQDLQKAIILAAKFHDLGKKRELWQRSIGNQNPTDWHAKSGRDPVTGKLWKPRDICPDYRHEFGSLLDAQIEPELQKLNGELKDLVLHLIAASHGRGRPHFPRDEAFDPEPKDRDADAVAAEVPQRFARLQRKYGRWGLAYLESLLRAADYAASAEPSATIEDEP